MLMGRSESERGIKPLSTRHDPKALQIVKGQPATFWPDPQIFKLGVDSKSDIISPVGSNTCIQYHYFH